MLCSTAVYKLATEPPVSFAECDSSLFDCSMNFPFALLSFAYDIRFLDK